MTVYVLRDGLPRQLRQRVLDYVREQHAGARVNQIGLEIAAFSILGSIATGTL